MKLFFLDGGTTNTRITLMADGEIKDFEKNSVGSCMKNNIALKQSVKEMITAMLNRNNLCESDVSAIVSSGMVTSELGLYELPHLVTPVGATELAKGIKKVTIDEITSIPFLFIPGVINNDALPDMMRGEEAECIGLIENLKSVKRVAVILPGTHNKIVLVKNKKIVSISSMMSGELLSALWHNTILSINLPQTPSDSFDADALLEGAHYCKKYGLTDAALRVRSMAKANTKTAEWLGSYLIGAVLYCDIIAIKEKAKGYPLLIGGSAALKAENTLLCKEFLHNKIIETDCDIAQSATTIGQQYIYKQYCEE